MSGTLLSLLDMTSYNFDDVGDAGSVETLLASNIDVSRYSSGDLLLRVHANSIGASASLKAELRRVLPSPQDPSKIFVQSLAGGIASVTVDNSKAAASLLMDALDAPLGSYLNLYLVATQASTATTLSATISVELALKS